VISFLRFNIEETLYFKTQLKIAAQLNIEWKLYLEPFIIENNELLFHYYIWIYESMKIKQLKYVLEVARNGLNISQAAESLHTVQPGVSTQIKLLEEEIGTPIFERYGKRMIAITPAGKKILDIAADIMQQVNDIKNIGAEFTHESKGTLTIATTHTQARYALPQVVAKFVKRFPNVQLRIYQGNPTQICEKVISGEADLVIATEAISSFKELVMLPIYQWNRCVVAPVGHEILKLPELTLQDLTKYPIITYDFAFTGRSVINNAFAKSCLTPNIALTAIDSDVIKHYVELGLGIGILASMAFSSELDKNLRSMDASHLFPDSTTSIGIRHGRYVRQYMYTFIEYFAPHLTANAVQNALGIEVR